MKSTTLPDKIIAQSNEWIYSGPQFKKFKKRYYKRATSYIWEEFISLSYCLDAAYDLVRDQYDWDVDGLV